MDINVFVYWLGNHPAFGKTAYELVKKIEESARGKYVTSTLTLYQTLMIIAGLTDKNLKDKKLVEKIVNSITSLPGLIITPLTKEDVSKAVSLMGEYDLDYEDALHLAAALRNKTKEIISNDQDYDKTPLKRKFL
ncbi:type II toxin-antitoxin system VapC family toxin [Candidatus Bathyarchaeota archaeon]|nr:type II toxin-antitoxin system VapC family toxin [Candidatus Bathyarchaeota archaeon]